MSSWFFLLPEAIAAMAEAETACNISEKNNKAMSEAETQLVTRKFEPLSRRFKLILILSNSY